MICAAIIDIDSGDRQQVMNFALPITVLLLSQSSVDIHNALFNMNL